MGTLSITIPQNVSGKFTIKDQKSAKNLLAELEQIGERVSAFDDVFGIWAGRPETEKELTEKLRSRSNRRDG